MKTKSVIVGTIIISLIGFIGWRFVRPLNIFVVSAAFERPIPTTHIPAPLKTLHAEECATCHPAFYAEWKTSIHSQAWTDPYFQTDWKFDGAQQICKNCHIPLDRQQEHSVLGFRDKEKWDPILAPNPDFDPKLQHEGVTCTACHLREGKIVGVLGDTNAPHPIKKLDNPNRICVQCHVVDGQRWDTFFRIPPCGTVAEIQTSQQAKTTINNEAAVEDIAALGCVECHMPLLERPLVVGGKVRATRQHIWRGGHDPAIVKRALDIKLNELPRPSQHTRRFSLRLTNVGAAHNVPTGTPDRHFTVALRLLDAAGKTVQEQQHILRRTILWRPFIIDLWDTRLRPGEPRRFTIDIDLTDKTPVHAVEAVVRYHLLDEKRRARIGYKNKAPIAYDVFRKTLSLQAKKI